MRACRSSSRRSQWARVHVVGDSGSKGGVMDDDDDVVVVAVADVNKRLEVGGDF